MALPRRLIGPLAVATVASACTAPPRADPAVLSPAPERAPAATLAAPAQSPEIVPAPAAPEAPDAPDLLAWLAPDAPGVELAATAAGWPEVERVVLVDGEDAIDEFTSRYPEMAGGIESLALPASLRIDLLGAEFLPTVARALEALAGVDRVVTATTQLCNPFPGWNIVVFTGDDRQLTRLRNRLLEAEGITDVTAVGRDAAYAEYLARHSAQPELAAVLDVVDMPVSLRARTSNPVTLALADTWFETDDAVLGVQVYPPGAPVCD